MAKAKLYVDEDITDALARALRAAGCDVISAHETGLHSRSDEDQLRYAIQEGRAFLTCNVKHFPRIAFRHYTEGRSHFGIVVSNQLELGEMLRRVHYLLDNWSAEELRDIFLWLTPVQ
ncbi:MAG: DUF5615 family PIN-like protein [Candidatus Latescibacteria bacterium]|nr:DUF5615 family PIN-like protein [Candidatus Latescibacterota bacterium]